MELGYNIIQYDSSAIYNTFYRNFGAYQLELRVRDPEQKSHWPTWQAEGWFELFPNEHHGIGFKRNGKVYSIKDIQKVQKEFAEYISDTFMPRVKSKSEIPKELSDLLK
ncbi:MAG TPA: hypothetical protein VJ110_01230 [Candidatus Nanoarchaeia archaeon]|nr:hypothetical protein [Candidatus Nanoarchaeia archaeon]